MGLLEKVRARAHAALERVPGKAGEKLRAANDALGRPFADESELAERREFEQVGAGAGEGQQGSRPGSSSSSGSGQRVEKVAAPVVVYHMDKTRRDAGKLVELLEEHKIPHQVSNIQEDPAAQMAVRRDSKGYRLPVVFIAGEPIGGRSELTNLATSGELKKKVFG